MVVVGLRRRALCTVVQSLEAEWTRHNRATVRREIATAESSSTARPMVSDRCAPSMASRSPWLMELRRSCVRDRGPSRKGNPPLWGAVQSAATADHGYAERAAGLPSRTASPWSWDRAARALRQEGRPLIARRRGGTGYCGQFNFA
jgi:hypothetical protein